MSVSACVCVCVCRPRDLAGEDSTDGLIDLLQGLELLHHQLVLMVDCVTNRKQICVNLLLRAQCTYL